MDILVLKTVHYRHIIINQNNQTIYKISMKLLNNSNRIVKPIKFILIWHNL
jgi:hypothetical protein